jgi:Ca-activated chloride channel family protein
VDRLTAEDWFGAQTGKPNKEIKDEIVDTALQHHLMTQYTSFVAVEEKTGTKNGQPIKIVVPVEVPDGVSRQMAYGEPPSPPMAGASAGGGNFLARSKTAYAASPRPQSVPAAPYPVSSAAPMQSSGSANGALSESDRAVSVDDLKAAISGKKSESSNHLAEKPKALRSSKNDKLSAENLPRDEESKNPAAVLSAVLDRLALGTATAQDLAGLELKNGEVTVKLKLSSNEDLKVLKTAGFSLLRRDKDGRLIGRIAIKKLRNLAAISFVQKVEAAKA